jgi:hypothetical protein
VLELHTAAAVGSDHWLGISSDSVEEFLQMEYMDVQELDLIKALLRWAKFQVQCDGDDPKDAQKLRVKLLPGFKHIRFSVLNKMERKVRGLTSIGRSWTSQLSYAPARIVNFKRSLKLVKNLTAGLAGVHDFAGGSTE